MNSWICSKVVLAVRRAGEHHRERHGAVRRIEQDAEQIQDLLRRTGAARKNDDAVTHTHERFQPLLDIRHDDQLADDRIGRLGGDDAGLGDAEVAAVDDALLRMADGRAFHRTLHRAGTAARAHVEAAQAELVAHFLRVVVLEAPDGMPAPAHHEIGPHLRLEHPRVAQDVKYGVGDARRGRQIEAPALMISFEMNTTSRSTANR